MLIYVDEETTNSLLETPKLDFSKSIYKIDCCSDFSTQSIDFDSAAPCHAPCPQIGLNVILSPFVRVNILNQSDHFEILICVCYDVINC